LIRNKNNKIKLSLKAVAMNTRLLILLLCIYATTEGNLPLGTRCLLRDNSTGICAQITNCEYVMEQVRLKTVKLDPPLVCSQSDRSVCCPIQSRIKVTTSTTTARPMRISEKSKLKKKKI
jgi:hypothetical protein